MCIYTTIVYHKLLIKSIAKVFEGLARYLTQLNLIVTAVISIICVVRILTVLIYHAPRSFCAQHLIRSTQATEVGLAQDLSHSLSLLRGCLFYHEHRLNNSF